MNKIFYVSHLNNKTRFCIGSITILSLQVLFDSLIIRILGIPFKIPRLFNLVKLRSSPFPLVPKPAILHQFIAFDYPERINNIVNLGDYVQTIATQNAILNIDAAADFTVWSRDSLSQYQGEPKTVVMQGWFAHKNHFIPSSCLTPIYIGMHLCKHAKKYIGYMQHYNQEYWQKNEVGCRDEGTLKFFQQYNIPSYFSRCFTLTLPKRTTTPENPQVFAVNLDDDIFDLLPTDIRTKAIRINQRAIIKQLSYQEGYKQTEELLNQYKKQAGLVITSALHCASPCIAMGIPTVIIYKTAEHLTRFNALKNIIPLSSADDLKNNQINWQTTAPDIEELKQLMLQNLRLSILKAQHQQVDLNELQNIRQKIAEFKTFNA